MAYFLTVLLLVQVLSVLADVGDMQLASSDISDESALNDGNNSEEEYPDWKDCDTLQPLNEKLENVFENMAGEVTFKWDCFEAATADDFLVGGIVKFDDTTHFNLQENTTELGNQDDVRNWVADPDHQWKDKVQAGVKNAKFNHGSVVYFGCSYGKTAVFCLYRNPGVDVSKIEEEWSKFDKEFKGEQLMEEESNLEAS